MNNKLTQASLKENLHYDPETGVFTWKNDGNNQFTKKGSIAGYKTIHGYRGIGIDYYRYYEHRLAWLYVYGYMPEADIDHIDRIKHHNWISNLRETSMQCNTRNTGNRKNNTSGIKGVSFDKFRNKWAAYITTNSKKTSLGIYSSLNNAVCARLAGEQCLSWAGCDSSSPAFKYVNGLIL